MNRLLTRSGKIPESWRHRLNLLLGTTDWYDAFYKVDHTPMLFEEPGTRVVKATTETMGRYFNDPIDLRDQCRRARVPFFFKQWGGKNKKRAGRLLEGRTWDEMPKTREPSDGTKLRRIGRSLPVTL